MAVQYDSETNCNLSLTPDRVVVGDFNGDGFSDLAWHAGVTLTLLTGRPDGTFACVGSNPPRTPFIRVHLGDLTKQHRCRAGSRAGCSRPLL